MTEKRIIIGGGGHALSIADAAACLGLEILGFIAPDAADKTKHAIPWLGTSIAATPALPHRTLLINGIGSAGPVKRHRSVYQSLRDEGQVFAALTHPTAATSALNTRFGAACQVLAGAVVNAGVTLGDNVLINSGAIVEHGCSIGSHSHVASGATVCGDCRIGESVHIGAGATLIQGIEIGSGSVIAAGAVVTANVEPLTLVAGVPARRLRSIDEQELA